MRAPSQFQFLAKRVIAPASKRNVYRPGSTQVRRRPRNKNNERNNQSDRQMKMMTSEGLAISQEQIQKLWNLFGDQESSKFDMKDFVSKFPNVNSSLTKQINVDASGDNDDLSSSFSLDMSEDACKFSPIAEEAEQKLQRMLDKIDQHDSLPPDIQTKIQNLLIQELETVLDLWLRISETSECQTSQEATAPIDRAAELLLKFQYLHEKGAKLAAKNNNAFYPPAPAIRSYQSIIQGYYQLLSSVEQYQSHLSMENIKHFQSQSRQITKGMMKQVLTMRMQSLHDDSSTSSSNQLSNTKPLHDSYTCVISMHTDPLTLSASESQNSLPSDTNMTEMANAASKLLKEMELYYHDFHTMPLPSSNPTSSVTNSVFPRDLQALLSSIYPTQESFQLVIRAFVRIASETDCKYSITRATDVLERMDKRYRAYVSISSSDVGGQVFKPDLELYMLLVGGYASMNNLGLNDAERIANVLKMMEEDEDIVVTDSTRSLVKKIQEKGRETVTSNS